MNAFFSNGRVPPGLWLIPLLMCVGSIFFIMSSPANASINVFGVLPTATQENLWAYANVSKPAYTATFITIPTDTPAPAVTEPPASMVMEIVENTPVSAVQELPRPVVSYGGSKYILVDISEQHMYVYEGDALFYSFVASTGIGNSTRVGTFQVQSKIPNAYASTWNLWMPHWLGIYWSHGLENGIHALPILSNGATLWDGYLGTPVSYGCVVLGTYEAQILYDWAEIGTPVEIQW
jgi:lipoprotein-anchoring transpeptidase ErfK/SrfK